MNHRTYQSADDLARRLGVSRATIYRWESGKIDPPFSLWIQYLKICDADILGEIDKIDIDYIDQSQMCD